MTERPKILVPSAIILQGGKLPVDSGSREEKFSLIIDETPMFLPTHLFLVATVMCCRRDIGDGWVHKSLIANPDSVARIYLQQMRREIYQQIPEIKQWPIIEAEGNGRGGTGRFRVVAGRQTQIVCDPELLLFPDARVQAEVNDWMTRYSTRIKGFVSEIPESGGSA